MGEEIVKKLRMHTASVKTSDGVLDGHSRARAFRLRPVAVAVISMFAAASHAAPPGAVLVPGTIPTGGVVASGDATIQAPQATASGNLLRIDQNSAKAVINWSTFDIAQGSQVHFNQPNAAAEMLNRIHDANPSLIQGRLTANGKVYLINQNGILFDRGSQVDVHTLIASSLDIPDATFNAGLVASPGTPVASGALTVIVDSQGQPLTDMEGRPLTNSVTNYGTLRSVEVDRDTGEVVNDAVSGKPKEPGGAIMLFAPKVENRGQISANNGQVVLAAGEQVYLSTYWDENAPDPKDPNGYLMRGLVVRVQAGNTPLNLSQLVAANFGNIQSNLGNTTLTGLLVNQSGRVTANSAATINGSIWLMADGTSGRLTTASGSVTEAKPVSDGTTLADDQDYYQFRPVIRMQGGTIDHKGSVTAPAGEIEVTAGRFYLGPTSTLSTAGLWTDLPYASNLLSVKLTSYDLRDSPVQKEGFLKGQTVTVDSRRGSPQLFDISEKIAGRQRSVTEKAAAAGNITVAADEFISAPGALIDLSGGGYRYAAGEQTTSYLVSGGRLYDVHTAPKDLVYDGVVNVNTQEAGYVEGKSAGTLTIGASHVFMGGDFKAGVTVGAYQRNVDAFPQSGRLVLGVGEYDDFSPVYALKSVNLSNTAPVLPSGFDADTPLSESALDQVILPSNLFGGGKSQTASYTTSGFGSLEVRARDAIVLPQDVSLDLGPLGSALFISRYIDLQGDIHAQGGALSFNARATEGGAGDPTVYMGPDARLSVAGGWINDAPELGIGTLWSKVINGGSISLKGNLTLSTGSSLDASGGAYYSSNHKLTYGKGGAISLLASIINGKPRTEDEIGRIELGASLSAYGGTTGGSLSLGAGQILIGSDSADPLALSLTPDFFAKGGFAAYRLDGYTQIDVAPNAVVKVVADSRLVGQLGFYRPSGTEFGSIATVVRQDAYLRGPTSLSMSVDTLFSSGISVGAGASISTETLGTISLASNAKLNVDGALLAPGGSIRLTLDQPLAGFYGGETLELGEHAVLSAAGTFVSRPGLPGEILGTLVPGGDITITARKNDLHISEGALLDVSGASHVMDLSLYGDQPRYVRQNVDAEAGSILISATENAVLDGQFLGRASATVAGGSFELDLHFHDNPPTSSDPDPRLSNYSRIVYLSQNPSGFAMEAEKRQAALSAKQLGDGGFDAVTIRASDRIAFKGDVALATRAQLRLDTPELLVDDGSRVTVTSSHVSILNTPNDFRSSTFLDGEGLSNDPVQTRSGTGMFAVSANLLSLAGHLTVNGVEQVSLGSLGDLRLEGFPVYAGTEEAEGVSLRALTGSLTTEGNLVLQANQIYPTTLANYTLAVERVDNSGNRLGVSGGTITVLQPANEATSPVLSAGGALTLHADHIVQDGVLKAPLGTIKLLAESDVSLGGNSVTSTSAAGLTIPFGSTRSIGQSLWYGSLLKTFDAPEKHISIAAPDVLIRSGALFDNTGGGDILATEWVPGIGGSSDVLSAAGTFAILPGVEYAAYDSQMQGAAPVNVQAPAAYDMVEIGDNGLVPAGSYALLPAYYALLPGAYLVRMNQASGESRPVVSGTSLKLNDGSVLVSGKLGYAGTGIRQSTWTGMALQPGGNALKEAEYRLSGSQFFADAAAAAGRPAPRLARDGGQLSIGATEYLQLQGTLLANPASGGRIGQVDIYSSKIAVVSRADGDTVPTGYVGLLASELSKLGASVMLGGVRTSGPDGQTVSVVAQDLKVALDQGDSFTAPEILLAARDTLSVSGTSTLEAMSAEPGGGGEIVTIAPDGSGMQSGAMLRLSTGGQMSFVRQGTLDFTKGSLQIQQGAKLAASGSMIMDATYAMSMQGDFVLPGTGAMTIAAGNIRLGDAPTVEGSLVLGEQQLAQLEQIQSLTLKSYSTVDIYGDVTLGTAGKGSLTIDSAGITGIDTQNPANAVLRYGEITLRNLGDAGYNPASTGVGTLTLQADSLILDRGEKAFSGFASVVLDADSVTLQDAGTLIAAADLNIKTAQIVAGKSADQNILACVAATCNETTSPSDWRSVSLSATSMTPVSLKSSMGGGKLSIAGRSVDIAGTIDLPSGRLQMVSHGLSSNDGIYLRSQGVLKLSSYERGFAGREEFNQYAAAGRVVFASDHGSIVTESGSSINLNGGQHGGDAGSISFTAENGQVMLDGGITAVAGAGFQQGNAYVDVASLGNFSDLNSALRNGGFAGALYLRARTGDIDINGPALSAQAAVDVVRAQSVQLVADAGSINVAGLVDVSDARGGGTVKLMANQDINLLESGQILARGLSTDSEDSVPYANGGKVGLYARTGGIDFAESALIDVSAASAGKSAGGEVVFSTSWTTSGVTPVLDMDLAGDVNISGPAGNGQVVIEGFRSYSGISTTSTASAATSSNAVWTNYKAFMGAASTIRNGVGVGGLSPADIKVRTAIELVNSGDITVNSAWDLTSANWNNTEPGGRLIIRSAGNLKVNNYLGLPSDTSALKSGWDLQLVAGADLPSADPMAIKVSSTKGDLTLANASAKLRTTDGSIQLAAGRDVIVSDKGAVIYTTGLPAIADSTNRFLAGGGDIEIRAGRDISGSNGNPQWLNDWLRRTTLANASQAQNKAGGWWADRSKFVHGIATFGGGAVSIVAQGSIRGVSASVASSAAVGLDQRSLRGVFGGGDMRVDAGGDVLGGQFLMGRGEATIRTAGRVGAFADGPLPTIWLQGYSIDPALENADVRVEALGSIDLATVSNPTVLPTTGYSNSIDGYKGARLYFFTYAPDASASLVSVGGDVSIDNQAPTVNSALSTAMSAVLPPQFSVVALQGNVGGARSFNPGTGATDVYQYPDTEGRFLALAAGSVHDLALHQSDVLPELLPQPTSTVFAPASATKPGSISLTSAGFQPLNDRLVAPSAGTGYRYAVVASEGDVSDSSFHFPKPAIIQAGHDVANVLLELQNLDATDVSIVSAGHDVKYSAQLANDNFWSTAPHLWVSGPGRLVIQAGRNISMGVADSIDAGGSNYNFSLPSTDSAALTVIAGYSLPLAQQGIDVLFEKLDEAGSVNDQAAANAAVAELFGDIETNTGSITMYQSRISTVGDSPIDLLAPGGDINVGLPTPNGGNIGIYTSFGGGIRAYLSGDMNVNLSKVVTLQGGDILLYTSSGSIDAGRGPRDSRTTQPPRIVDQLDPQTNQPTGVKLMIPPLDVGGSGIRTLSFDPDGPGPLTKPKPGNVHLYAPAGTIDAGEAGVSAAGDILVVAQQVLNASNFSAGGSTSGVPVVTSAPIVVPGAVSGDAAAAASKVVEATAQSAASNAANSQTAALRDVFRPSFITVEVLGFGNATSSVGGQMDEDERKRQ